MTDPLLRWVAELLKLDPSHWRTKETLQSWHGIGLVVEEMGRRGEEVKERFDDMLAGERWDEHWWWGPIPWDTVYTAARRAVEGR